ncbi:MAG TPA: hypothetical protein VKD21_09645 [Acidimicrobiales bacterium]|nr:hypothetical protein [Acidimicrobiales bacterium]
MTDGAGGPDDLSAFLGERLTRYVDLWKSASAKLSADDYHAEDLVDDWFRWIGMLARDATATVTIIARGAAGVDPEDPAG